MKYNPWKIQLLLFLMFVIAGCAAKNTSVKPPVHRFGQTTLFFCTATNAWIPVGTTCGGSGSSNGAPNMNAWYLSPNCGTLTNCTTVVWDVKVESDCGWTANTTQQVTCPEANFTTADLGKIEFGTQQESGYEAGSISGVGALVIPQGTITAINSSTVVTVSGEASGGCADTGGNLCTFAYGTQADDTGIATAEAAAWTSGTNCYTLVMPGGAAFVSTGHFNSVPGSACGGNAIQSPGEVGTIDIRQQGPELMGQGAGSTVLIPLPNFTYTTGTPGTGCGGIQSITNICFGAAIGLAAHDFTIDGLGVSSSSAGGTWLWATSGGNTCSGVQARNLHLSNWNFNVAGGTVGFREGSCAGSSTNDYIQNFGTEPCVIAGASSTSYYSFSHSTCFGGDGPATVEIGGQVATFGDQFSGNFAASNSIVKFDTNVHYLSTGDFFATQADPFSGQFIAWLSGTNMNISFSQDTFYFSSASLSGSSVFLTNGGTGTVSFHDTTVITGGATNTELWRFVQPGVNVIDGCGNTFQEGAVADIFDGQFLGQCSQLAQTSAATLFNANLSTQTISAFAPTGPVTINLNLIQSTLGVGCGAGTNTVTPTIAWTGPGGTSETLALSALSISANGTLDTNQNDSVTISAEVATKITYTTVGSLTSTGCSTTPKYTVYSKAVQ